MGYPQGFVQIHPDKIEWRSIPEMPSMEFAILLGDPQEEGPLLVRYKLPPDIQIAPHTHSDARTYTVLFGEWRLGFGEIFDAEALITFGPGSAYRLPAEVAHYQAAGPDGAVIQIESIGPTTNEFVELGNR